jgi:hypothetical protein
MGSTQVDSTRANRRETVLKKAGIIVAATAAGLLAVSPLAFAGEDKDHNDIHFTQVSRDSCTQSAEQERGFLLSNLINVQLQCINILDN